MRETDVDPVVRNRFHSLHRLIGNTPLLVVDVLFRGQPRRIFAKHESLNLTGSIKDRMALYVLEQAYHGGHIQPGDRIAEATSGNTGISFAALGRALGHPVTIFMPDWMSPERMSLIASFGADIVPVSRDRRAASSAASRRRMPSPNETLMSSCRTSSRTKPISGRTWKPPAPRSGCSWRAPGWLRTRSLQGSGRAAR